MEFLRMMRFLFLCRHWSSKTRMKKIVFIFLFVISFQAVNAVDITIKYRDGSSEIRHYASNTRTIKFNYALGRNTIEIAGLEQLKNLKELWLGMTTFIKNYDFLKKLNTLEILVFQDARLSEINFIYDITSIRRLIFQGCSINNLKIDISRLSNLEYFEFTNSQLLETPFIINEKQNMDIINIAYNNINNISIAEEIDVKIIAIGNPIQNAENKNLILGERADSIYYFLPEKYRQYIR